MIEARNAVVSADKRLPTPFLLAVFLCVGLGIRVWLAWLDIPLLFQKCLVDDAYFYFGIARNIVAGKGATFDGQILTNGFHPLYALILVPVFGLFPGDTTPIHVALTVLALFSAMTGLVVYAVVRALTGEAAGLLASFLWLFNPYVAIIGLSGVEVSIAAFFLALCLYQRVRMRGREAAPARDLVILGTLTALAILARMDCVFFFLALSVDILCRTLRGQKRLLPALSRLLIYGFTTLLVLSPWLLWNLLRFATVVPISGSTLPNIAHNMYLMQYGTYSPIGLVKMEIQQLWIWAAHIIRYGGGVALFVVLASLLLWGAARDRDATLRPLIERLTVLSAPIAATLLLVGFYALYFWGWHRPWYYYSVLLVLTVCGGAAGGSIGAALMARRKTGRRSAPVLALFLLAVYLGFFGWQAWDKGLYPFQKQLYESALWLDENTEKSARIGAISAGVYGYLTGRTIDLAGVVNQEAYQAMRERRIFSYLLDKGLDFLVDRQDMIEFYSNRFDAEGFMDRLTPVKRFGPESSDVVVYRLPSR